MTWRCFHGDIERKEQSNIKWTSIVCSAISFLPSFHPIHPNLKSAFRPSIATPTPTHPIRHQHRCDKQATTTNYQRIQQQLPIQPARPRTTTTTTAAAAAAAARTHALSTPRTPRTHSLPPNPPITKSSSSFDSGYLGTPWVLN